MIRFLDRWRQWVFGAFCISIMFLGIGRVEFHPALPTVSAWSIARTTFFFWLTGKTYGWFLQRSLDDAKQIFTSLRWLWVFLLIAWISRLPEWRVDGDFRYLLFGCVHALLVVDLCRSENRREMIFLMLGLMPLVLVARGVWQNPAVLALSLDGRFGFPLDHPNTAGYLIAMSLPLTVAVINSRGYPWRAFAVAALLAQLLGLLLTFSRGAWLAAVALFAFLGIAHKQKKLLALGCAGVLAVMVLVPSLRERASSLTQPSFDPSLSERSQIMRAGLQVGMSNPFLGVGYGRGNLKQEMRDLFPPTAAAAMPLVHSHNLYVELFAGTGLVGLSAFLWLTGTTLFGLGAVRRQGNRRARSIALVAAWIAVLVAGLGDIPFYHHETRMMLFTLLGLATLEATQQQEISLQ